MKASEKQKTSIVKSFKGAQDTDNRNMGYGYNNDRFPNLF